MNKNDECKCGLGVFRRGVKARDVVLWDNWEELVDVCLIRFQKKTWFKCAYFEAFPCSEALSELGESNFYKVKIEDLYPMSHFSNVLFLWDVNI